MIANCQEVAAVWAASMWSKQAVHRVPCKVYCTAEHAHARHGGSGSYDSETVVKSLCCGPGCDAAIGSLPVLCARDNETQSNYCVVGQAATPLSAAFLFFARDFAGMLGGILFALAQARGFIGF